MGRLSLALTAPPEVPQPLLAFHAFPFQIQGLCPATRPSVSARALCPHIFECSVLLPVGSPTLSPCSTEPSSSGPPVTHWPGVPSPAAARDSWAPFVLVFINCTSYLFASLQFGRLFGVQCGVSKLSASRLGHPPSAECGSSVLGAPCCGPLCGLQRCGAGHFHAGNTLLSLRLQLPRPLRNLAQRASFLLAPSLSPVRSPDPSRWWFALCAH